MRTIDEKETAYHLKTLKEEGYTLVEQFMDKSTVDRLLALVKKHNEVQTQLDLHGRPNRALGEQVHNLHDKDIYFIDILDDPFIQKVLMDNLQDPFYHTLPPHVPNYILGFYNARSTGTKALKLHMDTYIPSSGEQTWTMQPAFILEDCTIENGCTIVVPKSHRIGTFVDYANAKPEPVLAKAGDLVFWDSRIWHGTLANTTGKSRWIIIAVFTPWWVKQRSDITRSLSDEIYQELSDQKKVMLGFCSIPPKDEHERINFKGGFEDLLPSVKDYYQ